MIGPRALILTSIPLLPVANGASAQDRPIDLLTPSKNIVCQFFADNGQGVRRCDLMQRDTHPRRPADYHLPVRGDGTGLLRRHAARVLAGKGEAGGVLRASLATSSP